MGLMSGILSQNKMYIKLRYKIIVFYYEKMELPDKLELPDDVLVLIKEYAQPVTNPRWRHLHKMTNDQFYKQLFPHRIISFRQDVNSVIHMVCLRNLQMKIVVQKKEMEILIERADWL